MVGLVVVPESWILRFASAGLLDAEAAGSVFEVGNVVGDFGMGILDTGAVVWCCSRPDGDEGLCAPEVEVEASKPSSVGLVILKLLP